MTSEEIKLKRKYGDWDLLSEMIGTNYAQTAKHRFMIGDKTAIKGMERIIEMREQLVAEFRDYRMEIKNIDGHWTVNGKRFTEAGKSEKEFLREFFSKQNELIPEL